MVVVSIGIGTGESRKVWCYMANETTKEKTQLTWRMLGRMLFCDFPGGKTCSIDIDKVHESWKDFIWAYGIKQWAKDQIAHLFKFRPDDDTLAMLKEVEKAGDTENATLLKAQIKADRLAWLKANEAEIVAGMFEALKSLGIEKTLKEKSERESKAQAVANAKQTTIDAIRANMKAAGMTDEQIAIATKNL